jgi:prepilin peptidase dependent protein B
MIKSDSENIKTIQLNQELRTVMNLITRDLRRAGSNQNAAVNSTALPPTNPFSVPGSTRLAIASNAQGVANSCITYSYDANDGNDERYGFRLDSDEHTVETRSNGNDCNEDSWTNLTDLTYINISGLTFTDTTLSEAGVNIRQINVVLTGNLISDATVVRTLTETVRIRNDEF